MKASYYLRKVGEKSVVYVMLRYNKRQMSLSTGVSSSSGSNFSQDSLFSRKERDYREKNAYLMDKMSKIQRMILDYKLTTSGKDVRLENLIKSVFDKDEASRSKGMSLVDCMRELMSTYGRKGTIALCNDAMQKVAEFDGKVTLDGVTKDWIEKFRCHLLESLCENTANAKLKWVRRAMNYAIDNEYTTNYPFRKFKIKVVQTIKRSLTLEQLRAIRDFDGTGMEKMYTDAFMLIFYLCGINMTDLIDAKRLTNNGRIEYYRRKTGRLYSVKVEPEAMMIIEKFRGGETLLGIERFYKKSDDFFNGMSRVISRLLGFRVTSYWARHTFATMMIDIDIPREIVANALGHSQGSVTDVYIRFNQKKVDEAVRKLIDYVNSDISVK